MLEACLAVLLSSCFLSLHVASAAEKVTATLFVPDALTRPDRPVKLEARVLEDALLVRSGLGGEQLEFLVGGKRVGTSMTGGDGRGFLEYTPRMRGNLRLTVRLMESPRVASAEGEGTLFSWERRRPILLVETAGLIEEKTPGVRIPSLPGVPALSVSPTPAPGAPDELKRLTEFYFNVMYVTQHADTGDADAMRQWLWQHRFPPGPLVAVRPGQEAITAMIDGLRADGWDNVKAGIGRTRDFAEALGAMRLDVVIVSEAEPGPLPKKAQTVTSWKEVRKKRL